MKGKIMRPIVSGWVCFESSNEEDLFSGRRPGFGGFKFGGQLGNKPNRPWWAKVEVLANSFFEPVEVYASLSGPNQFPHFNIQALSNPGQSGYRTILLSPLHGSDIGVMEFGLGPKFFLR
jgi:hypothetical protein